MQTVIIHQLKYFEIKQMANFVRLIKALPLKMSAGGYFTVGRKNVTSVSIITKY